MKVCVTIHVDLEPEENRDEFNEAMEKQGWDKLPDVFTTWTGRVEAPSVDAARDKAKALARKAAKVAAITFIGAIVAGDTLAQRFDSEPSLAEYMDSST